MKKAKDLGIGVTAPKKKCEDMDCPFHGVLSVRGSIITGKVVTDSMQHTVVVQRDYNRYVPKYERLERRSQKYHAHSPPCLKAKKGDDVRIMECRPLSKTVSYVVVEVK